VQVLRRAGVVSTTTDARRNKGAWSSLGLGLSLGDFLGDILGDFIGDILAKYGASCRERESSAATTATVVYGTCSVNMETLSLVRYPWRRRALPILSYCCS
jgi:hypothetical protein